MCHITQTLGRDTRKLYAHDPKSRSQISYSIIPEAAARGLFQWTRHGYKPQMNADARRSNEQWPDGALLRPSPARPPLRSWFEGREKERLPPVCPCRALTDALSHGPRTMTVQRKALAPGRVATCPRPISAFICVHLRFNLSAASATSAMGFIGCGLPLCALCGRFDPFSVYPTSFDTCELRRVK